MPDSLGASERRRLYEAALDNQEFFNALAEEDTLREVFEDPVFRQRAIRRLCELHNPTARGAPAWTRWFGRPAVLVPATAIAIMLIGVGAHQWLNYPRQGTSATDPARDVELKGLSVPSGSANRPAVRDETVLERPGATGGATLSLNRPGAIPRYRIGERLRIEFAVPREADVLLLAEDPDGAVTRLFPNRYQSSTRVRANSSMLVPRAGQGGLRMSGPGGRYRLTLSVFPPGTNPLDAGTDERITVVEREYDVVREREL